MKVGMKIARSHALGNAARPTTSFGGIAGLAENDNDDGPPKISEVGSSSLVTLHTNQLIWFTNIACPRPAVSTLAGKPRAIAAHLSTHALTQSLRRKCRNIRTRLRD